MMNLLLISLVLTSYNIFGLDDSSDVQVKLTSETISLNEKATVEIKNLTGSRIRLICGYSIEVLQKDKWQHHDGLGCLPTAASTSIQSEAVYTRKYMLFAQSPGTYRIVLAISILKEGKWFGETIRTNSIQIK